MRATALHYVNSFVDSKVTPKALRIVFVHTPMSTVAVPERQAFWQNFDRRYHEAHPGLRHMRRNMWELPHWMTWLAGVLVRSGYANLGVLDLYTTDVYAKGSAKNSLDTARIAQMLRAEPADVYLFSPMTPNLHLAFEVADMAKLLFPRSLCVFGGVVATPIPGLLA